MNDFLLYLFFCIMVFLPHFLSRVVLTNRLHKSINIYHAVFFLLSSVFFLFSVQYSLLYLHDFLDTFVLLVFGVLPYFIYDEALFYIIAKRKYHMDKDRIYKMIFSFVKISSIIFVLEIVLISFLLLKVADHF